MPFEPQIDLGNIFWNFHFIHRCIISISCFSQRRFYCFLFCVQMRLKLIFSCSGYIHFTGFLGDKSYFFWLLESRSNPSTDPLVVWLTGGPGGHSSSCILSFYFIYSGCSSQMALLTENGPCWANEYGNGTIPNEFSWTNKANVIWVKLKWCWSMST